MLLSMHAGARLGVASESTALASESLIYSLNMVTNMKRQMTSGFCNLHQCSVAIVNEWSPLNAI